MEDDQFGNTNKQTIKQTEIVLSVLNQMRYYWIRCDDLYTWSAHMIIISHYQICLSDDDDDDDDDMRWWRYWWCIYTEVYKGAARDECIYKAWELTNLFQVWVVFIPGFALSS
jgi:hypothetical protein